MTETVPAMPSASPAANANQTTGASKAVMWASMGSHSRWRVAWRRARSLDRREQLRPPLRLVGDHAGIGPVDLPHTAARLQLLLGEVRLQPCVRASQLLVGTDVPAGHGLAGRQLAVLDAALCFERLLHGDARFEVDLGLGNNVVARERWPGLLRAHRGDVGPHFGQQDRELRADVRWLDLDADARDGLDRA